MCRSFYLNLRWPPQVDFLNICDLKNAYLFYLGVMIGLLLQTYFADKPRHNSYQIETLNSEIHICVHAGFGYIIIDYIAFKPNLVYEQDSIFLHISIRDTLFKLLVGVGFIVIIEVVVDTLQNGANSSCNITLTDENCG